MACISLLANDLWDSLISLSRDGSTVTVIASVTVFSIVVTAMVIWYVRRH